MMMKLRILLELEEGQKSREVWKKSWRGVVWEAMKFWNIWRKIVSVVFRYNQLFFSIIWHDSHTLFQYALLQISIKFQV